MLRVFYHNKKNEKNVIWGNLWNLWDIIRGSGGRNSLYNDNKYFSWSWHFQLWHRSNGGSTVGALTQIKAMPSTCSRGHCILPPPHTYRREKGMEGGKGEQGKEGRKEDRKPV